MLVLQGVEGRLGDMGPIAGLIVETVIQWLQDNTSWSSAVQRTSDGKAPTPVHAASDALPHESIHFKTGHYSFTSNGHVSQCDLDLETDKCDLICTVALAESRATDILASMTALAIKIFGVATARGSVGPVFVLRPFDISYSRPRPPRHSTLWTLGEAGYFVSEAFQKKHPLGDPSAIQKLREHALHPSLVRLVEGELTVLRVAGPAESSEIFARQRHDLEVWLSAVLDLRLDPQFNPLGDQRLALPGREEPRAAPFTVYDATRRLAVKAVATGPSGALASGMSKELKRILGLRKLDDGRTVSQAMVAFPDRESAVRHAQDIAALGGAGVLYVGDDHKFWNPNPPGDWTPVDWTKV